MKVDCSLLDRRRLVERRVEDLEELVPGFSAPERPHRLELGVARAVGERVPPSALLVDGPGPPERPDDARAREGDVAEPTLPDRVTDEGLTVARVRAGETSEVAITSGGTATELDERSPQRP